MLAALLIASVLAADAPARLELKGLTIGMSQSQLQERWGAESCAPAGKALAGATLCGSSKETLANYPAELTVEVIEGEACLIMARFSVASFEGVLAAFVSKYGRPNVEGSHKSAHWRLGGAELTILKLPPGQLQSSAMLTTPACKAKHQALVAAAARKDI